MPNVPPLPPPLDSPTNRQLLQMLDAYAVPMGYYDRKISLDADLSAVALPDAALTAHAPLWGTKAGKEKAVPLPEVLSTLNGLFRFAAITRHAMQLALHPDGSAVCFFCEVKIKLKACPCGALTTVPLILVANVTRKGDASPLIPLIATVHEYPAKNVDEGAALLPAPALCGRDGAKRVAGEGVPARVWSSGEGSNSSRVASTTHGHLPRPPAPVGSMRHY
ncbi:hypothetical protein T492DRAFT_833730 [Pavlovales sp. CCMP2436]|nr:hypothetical protein T492DRAFT_833730 [Pavlovales sp. CCMP2436]